MRSTAIYVNVSRGVPALVSVIWVYFGLSLLVGISFTVFQAGVIALVFLYGAFGIHGLWATKREACT